MRTLCPTVCLICGESVVSPGEGTVCQKCRERFGHVAGMSEDEESGRILAALLQIERIQHEETSRKLAKAEHDRDRYYRRIVNLTEGIQSIINKSVRICRPARNATQNKCGSKLEDYRP